MTDTTESHQPNEYGFGGAGTAPEPEPTRTDTADGEGIAVPAGDLTGAITGAMDEITERRDDDES
jgi:hypothetical protein